MWDWQMPTPEEYLKTAYASESIQQVYNYADAQILKSKVSGSELEGFIH